MIWGDAMPFVHSGFGRLDAMDSVCNNRIPFIAYIRQLDPQRLTDLRVDFWQCLIFCHWKEINVCQRNALHADLAKATGLRIP